MLPADVASEPDGITLEMCCKGDIRVIEVPDRTARSLALGFVKGFADLDDTRYVDATRTTYDAFLLTDPEHPGIKVRQSESGRTELEYNFHVHVLYVLILYVRLH